MQRRRQATHHAVRLVLAVAMLGCASVQSFQYPRVPERHKTPGDLCTPQSANFAEYRYRERIPYCRRSVTEATKTRIYESYGIPKEDRGNYTIDHLIPLSIGGSNSPKNLWPEHKAVKATRPRLEQHVYEAIRDGRAKQRELVEQVLEIKFDPDSEYLDD